LGLGKFSEPIPWPWGKNGSLFLKGKKSGAVRDEAFKSSRITRARTQRTNSFSFSFHSFVLACESPEVTSLVECFWEKAASRRLAGASALLGPSLWP